MPRKPSPIPPQSSVELKHEVIEVTKKAGDALAILDRQLPASLEVGILVGRMQVFDFFGEMSKKALVTTYKKLRDAMHEVGSISINVNGKVQKFTNLDDLCPFVLGKSADRCQKLLSHVEMLGEEVYEATEKLGFKTRDYQALKSLPLQDQARVKAAINAADKTEAIDLLHDFAARSQRADARIAELDEKLKAKDDYLVLRNDQITELQTRGKWKPSEGTVATSEAEAALIEAMAPVRLEMVKNFSILSELLEDFGASKNEAMRVAGQEELVFLAQYLAEAAIRGGYEIDFAERLSLPDHAKPKR